MLRGITILPSWFNVLASSHLLISTKQGTGQHDGDAISFWLKKKKGTESKIGLDDGAKFEVKPSTKQLN